jgi:lipoate-protein ligase A
LCKFLFEFYKILGFSASFAKDTDLKLSKSKYCQEGFEPYDVIIMGKKIGGNAQKWSKNRLLQHGSIPIKKLIHPYAGYSLEDFDVRIDENEAKELLKYAFQKSYDVRFIYE